MFMDQLCRWIAAAMIAASFPVIAQVESRPDYGKQLSTPADGRIRPSALTGVEEAYLTPIFASSHAANLLKLKNGDLLCVWFSGTWEGESDVAILMARLPKGATQWSLP